jgi:hypothetical protein
MQYFMPDIGVGKFALELVLLPSLTSIAAGTGAGRATSGTETVAAAALDLVGALAQSQPEPGGQLQFR